LRGIYIGNNKSLVSPVWGGKLIVPADDLSLSPDLLLHGVHEPELTNYFLKNIKNGFTVLDVGANLGYFTVLLGYLVGPGGKVMAYEADPDMYSFLMDNISINYLHQQVDLHNKAVYSSTASLSFYSTERFKGHASIYPHGDHYFRHYNDVVKQIQVQAEHLDIYQGKIDHIDLIKMDIEGGEYQAFMGMAGLLESRVVDTVVFEINRPMLNKDWSPLYSFLSQLAERHGVRFFNLTMEGDTVPTDLDRLFSVDGNPCAVIKF